MSDVEETLERVKIQSGVEGYVICNQQGVVLRRLPSMTQAAAETYVQREAARRHKAHHGFRHGFLDARRGETNNIRRARAEDVMSRTPPRVEHVPAET